MKMSDAFVSAGLASTAEALLSELESGRRYPISRIERETDNARRDGRWEVYAALRRFLPEAVRWIH